MARTKAKKAKKAVAKKSAGKKSPAKKVPVKKTSSQSTGKKVQMKVHSSAITPLEDRIVVVVDPVMEKTEGGLFIPGTVSERPSKGTVLAKGPGRRTKKGVVLPLDVSVGDKVLFSQYSGQKVEMNGDEFLILREEEVLAISID